MCPRFWRQRLSSPQSQHLFYCHPPVKVMSWIWATRLIENFIDVESPWFGNCMPESHYHGTLDDNISRIQRHFITSTNVPSWICGRNLCFSCASPFCYFFCKHPRPCSYLRTSRFVIGNLQSIRNMFGRTKSRVHIYPPTTAYPVEILRP